MKRMIICCLTQPVNIQLISEWVHLLVTDCMRDCTADSGIIKLLPGTQENFFYYSLEKGP